MPDPLEELSKSRLDVTPLPAAEVRARGDRLRRRRATLSVVGAATAVAAVVVAVSVAGGGADQGAPAPPATSSPAPAPSQPVSPSPGGAVVNEIPPDFPLDIDQLTMARDGGQVTGPSEQAPGVAPVRRCGTDIWPVTGQDRLASRATGAEHVEERELVTYLDAEAAVNVMTMVRQALEGCPTETVEGPDGNPATLVHQVVDDDLGYDSVTVASYLDNGAPGLTVLRFVRVGSAVLAEALSGEGSAPTVDANVKTLDAVSLALAAEMCVFTEAGCAN